MLKLEKLARKEGQTTILRDIDLEWRQGLLAILGGNGSGKSTLMRILAGALKPSAGSALWSGLPVRKAAATRGMVGYGPQERALDLSISLREFLCLCADLRGLPDRAKQAQAIAEELGIAPQLDIWLAHLSGGNRRKAMTAQAMMGDPALLLLDEPTSEVDFAAARHFWTLFKERAQRRAVLVITHDVDLALEHADQILLLRRGHAPQFAPAARFTRAAIEEAITAS